MSETNMQDLFISLLSYQPLVCSTARRVQAAAHFAPGPRWHS